MNFASNPPWHSRTLAGVPLWPLADPGTHRAARAGSPRRTQERGTCECSWPGPGGCCALAAVGAEGGSPRTHRAADCVGGILRPGEGRGGQGVRGSCYHCVLLCCPTTFPPLSPCMPTSLHAHTMPIWTCVCKDTLLCPQVDLLRLLIEHSGPMAARVRDDLALCGAAKQVGAHVCLRCPLCTHARTHTHSALTAACVAGCAFVVDTHIDCTHAGTCAHTRTVAHTHAHARTHTRARAHTHTRTRTHRGTWRSSACCWPCPAAPTR